jgi:hypothetical protein
MSESDRFSALNARQLEALSDVAFGGTGRTFHPRTLESLVRLELIEPVQRSEQTGMGEFRWTEYTMPLGVHIAFCEWCSTEVEG